MKNGQSKEINKSRGSFLFISYIYCNNNIISAQWVTSVDVSPLRMSEGQQKCSHPHPDILSLTSDGEGNNSCTSFLNDSVP